MRDFNERWTAYQAQGGETRERYRLALFTTAEGSCTACLGAFVYAPDRDSPRGQLILDTWTTWDSPSRAAALKRAEEITGPFENYEWDRS